MQGRQVNHPTSFKIKHKSIPVSPESLAPPVTEYLSSEVCSDNQVISYIHYLCRMNLKRLTWQYLLLKRSKQQVYRIFSVRTYGCSPPLSLDTIKQLGLLKGSQGAFDALCKPLCTQSILDQED